VSRHKGRNRPSDPQAILAANALRRGQAWQAERQAARNPELWGPSAEILRLPAHADVEVTTGARGRIVQARRCDPFDLLLSAGGLSDFQHRAARRLMRDWCIAAGVRDQERPELGKIDGGGSDPQVVNQAMIDADKRRARALKAIGGVNAKLMGALIGQMVDQLARVFVWRVIVAAVTGERDRNAQGALVRQACESLLIHYDDEDEAERRKRGAPGGRDVLGMRSLGEISGEGG
jgi:hypothetical protein